MQPLERPFELVEANLREAMRFFGDATGKGRVCDLGAVQAIYSGLNYGVFNIAMLTGDTRNDELPSRLEQCAAFYAKYATRWSFWLCEQFLHPGKPRRDAPFTKMGLRRISHAPGMIAEVLKPPSRPLPEIECVRVNGVASREAFGGVTAVSFDIPIAVVREVYYPETAWRGSYHGYLGKVRGRVVGIVAIVAAAGSLGVYSLATMPDDRRRGYGEALLRAALEQERQQTGLDRVVLQSTEAGHALYKRIGFREVAQFSVYLTR